MRRMMFLGLAVVVTSATWSVTATWAQEGAREEPSADAMAAAFERVKGVINPGPHHEKLQRFLGTWDMESRFIMFGKPSKGERAVVECTWLIEGRWLQFKTKGKLMGRDYEDLMIMGYDNMKMSYVTMWVSNMDTAMRHSEGDMDPGGDVLLTYGTLDEYLTGEHDKMVKYVWRFKTADEIVMEVHDLPIGESNTKVVEATYTRRN